MSPLRTGYGRAVNQLVTALSIEFHEMGAFRNVAVFRIDDTTTITRGTYTNRLDGYGLTKKMIALARAELRRMGYRHTFDEVDELFHHAELHRAGHCTCQRAHFNPQPITGGENQQNVRARRIAAGLCARCGKKEPTNGTVCRSCLDHLVQLRRLARARKKEPQQEIEELPY